jgi:very-short-patch-repair endonuclease
VPRLADPDPHLPDVVTAAEAYAAGLTRHQVRQRIRSGRWRPLAHGVYARTSHAEDVDRDLHATEAARHAEAAVAAALAFPGAAVALHSAAVLHALPTWRPLLAEVALNVPYGRWNGNQPGVRVHRMRLAEDDIDCGMRVPVTSVARTCVDLARLAAPAYGLAVIDAALRAQAVERTRLDDAWQRSVDRRGAARAQVLLREADGRRESVAESGSWAYFMRHAIARPEVQVEVRTALGALVRVDFLWRAAGVVGECDGRAKYVAPEDLYREKRREDELRALGLTVVRWGWADLRDPALAARLAPLVGRGPYASVASAGSSIRQRRTERRV